MTGAVARGDSERTSDTASDTIAENRGNAFIRLSGDPTFRCRTLSSPRNDTIVHRGEGLPTGWVMAGFRFTGGRTVPLSGCS